MWSNYYVKTIFLKDKEYKYHKYSCLKKILINLSKKKGEILTKYR